MNDVNWWLMALSFLLGLLLTFAFMIRRVTREAPIFSPLGRGPKAEAKKPAAAATKPAAEATKPAAEAEAKKPGAEAAPAVATAAAAAPLAAKVIKEEPYGAGSVRVSKSVAPPRSEFLIKGDEDAMRYLTVDSPDYEKVGAEVWFQDAESAERAGFQRWDATGDATVADDAAAATETPETTEATEAATSAAVAGEPEAGPYGAGSAHAGADGVGPIGWTIKGNEDSKLYHTPASEAYEETVAEIWFADEATAEAAGFKKYK